MKKLICLLLSVFMLFSLGGCIYESYELDEEIASGVVSELEDYLNEQYPDYYYEDTSAAETTEATTEAETTTETTTAAETTTTAAEVTTTSETTTTAPPETEPEETEPAIDEDGTYTTKDDVALYVYTYGRLPKNFITKKEAQALGWEGGSLEPYAPGMCIGGSHFGNYEGLLPEKDGRKYTECDIDTLGKKSRGAKRIVFSNYGLIYYTDDHYESFELLYGEE